MLFGASSGRNLTVVCGFCAGQNHRKKGARRSIFCPPAWTWPRALFGTVVALFGWSASVTTTLGQWGLVERLHKSRRRQAYSHAAMTESFTTWGISRSEGAKGRAAQSAESANKVRRRQGGAPKPVSTPYGRPECRHRAGAEKESLWANSIGCPRDLVTSY